MVAGSEAAAAAATESGAEAFADASNNDYKKMLVQLVAACAGVSIIQLI